MATDYSYIGSVEMWSGTYAPLNWMFCQGQLLSISQYTAFYAIIGTIYGGNATTNFAVPDMRGRVPLGVGQLQLPGGYNYTLGTQAGAERVTLAIPQMPSHTHTATFTPAGGNTLSASVSLPVKTGLGSGSNNPVGNYFGGSGTASIYYTDYTAGSTMAPVPVDISGTTSGGTVTVSSTGGTAPFEILQPFTVLNFIICFNGQFPPHNN